MFNVPTLADLKLEYTLPVLILVIGVCFLIVIDLFIPKAHKTRTAWLALALIVASFVANLLLFSDGGLAFSGMYIADEFAAFLNIVTLLTTAIVIFLSIDYLKRANIERGEFYSFLIISSIGMMFMAGANDLIVIFVALELLSIPLYVLAAFRQPETKSQESGMKYFILGAFASAFLVYGAALIYGATGTTNLQAIFKQVQVMLAEQSDSIWLLLIGTALMLVGLGFKVAVVPFHMWTPDVYEGSPTPVTAFMSVGAKAGGFAALLRVLAVGLPVFILNGADVAVWQQVVSIIAAATLILGNFVAISQTNIKRLLAYSSIAHAGYILMAVAAAGTPGVTDSAAQAVLIYLMVYMFTNLGAFGVVMAVEKDDGSGTELEDYVGLAKSRPLLALIMAVFMLSFVGIPLTGGFIGKWFVFRATLESGLVWLAVIGVLTSVASAFYYVRVVVNMYLRDGDGDAAPGATRYVTWAVYVAFAATVLLGIFVPLITNLTDMVTITAVIP